MTGQVIADGESGAGVIEDRGTPYTLWRAETVWWFCWVPNSWINVEVSVPIGWSLVQAGDEVVLEDLFRRRLSAGQVFRLAEQGRDGFRLPPATA